MAWTDELDRLHALHQKGALTDDEFARAKERLLQGTATGCTESLRRDINALRRSTRERWVAGVCGGLAKASGLAPWAWRLGFALLSLFGGTGLVVYVLLWIFVPPESAAR